MQLFYTTVEFKVFNIYVYILAIKENLYLKLKENNVLSKYSTEDEIHNMIENIYRGNPLQ